VRHLKDIRVVTLVGFPRATADLFITNERNTLTTDLLSGIPHSLLLSNSNGEQAVLVPSIPPVRPAIHSVPFSTELVLDRGDILWYEALENPYYVRTSQI
jgi:hypothetical protein